MAVYKYRSMALNIPEFDHEFKGFFAATREHRLVVQGCLGCSVLRWGPGPACPFCGSLRWEWREVSGRGTIYSYQIACHAVQTGFRDLLPFPVVLVEMDERTGAPDPGYGLRMIGRLVDSASRPETEDNVAIGKRVQVAFEDTEEGITLPQWRLAQPDA